MISRQIISVHLNAALNAYPNRPLIRRTCAGCLPQHDLTAHAAAPYNTSMTEQTALKSTEYAQLAVDVAEEKIASDIVLLDIRDVSDFADYFVILTAESSRQMAMLSEEIEHALERKGYARHHREGTPHGGWMLLDFGDVIIHIFGPEEREFYSIESAWSEGVEVVRIQ